MTEPSIAPAHPGRRAISEALRRFTDEFPFERGPILDFVIKVADQTPAGAAVLDLGAGDAPYRELFRHARYTTTDWSESQHEGGRSADIVAGADALPIDDQCFDLVVCTQVLEHVPEPLSVLAECRRILVPGGRLALSVPLLWELHEMPHDYFRYTQSGIRHLLDRAGFTNLEIAARSDGFSALAQLMLNLRWAMGEAPDGLDDHRVQARGLLERLAAEFGELSGLDVVHSMALGYTAVAIRA